MAWSKCPALTLKRSFLKRKGKKGKEFGAFGISLIFNAPQNVKVSILKKARCVRFRSI